MAVKKLNYDVEYCDKCDRNMPDCSTRKQPSGQYLTLCLWCTGSPCMDPECRGCVDVEWCVGCEKSMKHDDMGLCKECEADIAAYMKAEYPDLEDAAACRADYEHDSAIDRQLEGE